MKIIDRVGEIIIVAPTADASQSALLSLKDLAHSIDFDAFRKIAIVFGAKEIIRRKRFYRGVKL
jgi:hypothetical protein